MSLKMFKGEGKLKEAGRRTTKKSAQSMLTWGCKIKGRTHDSKAKWGRCAVSSTGKTQTGWKYDRGAE